MIRAEIMSVGDEVVSGQIVDSNAAWLSRQLVDLGISVVAHVVVADVEEEIERAVLRAAERSDVVIVTGGLGPTHDDVTREAVARSSGTELVLDPPSLEHMRGIFAAHGFEMPASNARQAGVPRGADVLPNATGTAAGFRITIGGASVFVLPGVPAEMEAMFESGVVPLLPEAEDAVAVRALKCFGMSESIIAETVAACAEMELTGNPKVAFLASQGTIAVKFTARGKTREAALGLIEPLLARAREALGDVVFGEDGDTLQEAVARLLEARGLTIAVAESCTGGLVADMLTNVPGISEHFIEGVVAYSNQSKTRLLGVPEELFRTVGAVSEQVARLMAENVRVRSGADVGVGVTGIAGPAGGSPDKPVGTVHIAVATARRTAHRKCALRGTRTLIKNRAARHTLNMVRLELLT